MSLPAPLHFEVAGCTEVAAAGDCALPEDPSQRTLTLWTADAGAALLTVRAGEEGVPAAERTVQGGRQLRVEVPVGAALLTVTSAGPTPREWHLRLRAPASCPAVEAAAASRTEHEAEAGLAMLAAATPACRPAAASLRARLLLDLDRPREAVEAFEAAVALGREAGRASAVVDDTMALVYVLTYKVRDFAAARAALARAAADTAGYDVGRARLAYYGGRTALESGDLRAALRSFVEADARAERLGVARLLMFTNMASAEVLLALGREPEAVESLEGLGRRGAALPPCDEAAVFATIGWAQLQQREGTRRVGSDQDPRPALRKALEAARGGCPSPAMQASALVDLALAELLAGSADAAAARLDEARRAQPEPDAFIRDWSADLEGRVAAARGDPARALAIYEALVEAAAPLSGARWRARLGVAQALEGLGRVEPAVAAYEEAERLLDEQRLLVPLGEGRGSFVGDRDRGARRLVALLVRQGRADGALDAARRSRTRVLSSLGTADRVASLGDEARKRWEHSIAEYRRLRAELGEAAQALRVAPADEREAARADVARLEDRARATLDAAYAASAAPLVRAAARTRAAQPGVVVLAYHPGDRGWIGFAAAGGEVVAQPVQDPGPEASPDELSRALLAPFGETLSRARRIHILPYGRLSAVDFHALPFRDDVLAAVAPVAYPLDLGGTVPSVESPLALVVADPDGTLRAARQDAERVPAHVRAWPGWRAEVLAQRDATRERVLSMLGGAGLLHFAGHARLAGREGWDSALALAGRTELTVGDVLAQPRVPARVVLSACESGAVAADTLAPTLGLAQAFALAGAREVVATARPVADDVASRLADLLYEAPLHDTTAALRDASLALRRSCDRCDWAAWRVVLR